MSTRTIREHLMARRRELLARYKHELELADDQDGFRPETVEASTEQWEVSVLATMSDSDARALDEVIAALARLTAGTYGVCTSCGEHIAPKRLQVVAEAALCARCATVAEQAHVRRVASR